MWLPRTSIPAGSGIKQAAAPLLTIGAGIASGQTDYGTSSALEFVGYIADVATYKSALSVGQVLNHYLSVPGNFVSFISILHCRRLAGHFRILENGTLTIPMTVCRFGSSRYYWANVTTGGAVNLFGANRRRWKFGRNLDNSERASQPGW